jgi:hypothetical protein
MGLRRIALVAVAALLCTAATHTEDSQLHYFPGGLSGPGVGASVLQFGADSAGGLDSTAAFQAAVDTGGLIRVPVGTYAVCPTNTGSILVRHNGTHLLCDKGATLVAGTLCPNVITLAAVAGQAVSTFASDITIEGCTFSGGKAGANMIIVSGDDAARVKILRNRFELSAAAVGLSSGANGVGLSGSNSVDIDDNLFDTIIPGHGLGVNMTLGAHDLHIRRNKFRLLNNGISIGTGASSILQNQQVEDGADISGNSFDGGFYTNPPGLQCGAGASSCTNSGGTVTYAATTLTDTGLTLGGLCSGGFSSTCLATTTCSASCPGNIIRAMVPLVTSANAATSFFPDTRINDSTANFVGSSVRHGDLVRTTPKLCNGMGQVLISTTPPFCPGGAGLGGWGDGCTCTAAADCSSGVCEKRFAIVSEPQSDDGTKLWIEGWTSDVSRQPVAAPPLGTPYVVYDPTLGQVHDFNSGTGVINLCIGNCTGPMNGWHDLLGTATTPANGTLYEILATRPNYTGLSVGSSARGLRISDNDCHRSFSDCISLFGYRSVVSNNRVDETADACFTMNGQWNTIAGNTANRCGSSCMFVAASDSTISNNVLTNCTWGSPNSSGTLGDITFNTAASRNIVTHNHFERIQAIPSELYGVLVEGSATADDGNVLDGNLIRGSYVTSPYRFDKLSFANPPTNIHVKNWGGEAITVAGSPTYTVEGGVTTSAGLPAGTGNGSYVGCSDCMVANPCAGAGTGAVAKRQGGAWVCN